LPDSSHPPALKGYYTGKLVSPGKTTNDDGYCQLQANHLLAKINALALILPRLFTEEYHKDAVVQVGCQSVVSIFTSLKITVYGIPPVG